MTPTSADALATPEPASLLLWTLLGLSASPFRHLRPRGGERVVHQHDDCHRTDAAGDGGDRAGDFLCRFEIDIADEAAFSAVDSHVDHRRAGFDHWTGDEFRPADRGDKNVRLP